MKALGILTMIFLVLTVAIQPAWAVDTSQTYQSGLLVLLFLGVCALIVVAQMVPALILMMGTISGLAKRIAAKKQVATVSAEQENNH